MPMKLPRLVVDRALAWCDRALEIAPDDASLIYNAACILAKLGRREAALDYLERNCARGAGKREWVENDSDWDAFRDDPRFKELLTKLP
jgi:adenylate cyclase